MKYTNLFSPSRRSRNSTLLGADWQLNPLRLLTQAFGTTAHATAIVLFVLGTLATSGTAFAQGAGSLDPTFSGDGKMTFDVGFNGGSRIDVATDGALQIDDKIIVVGKAGYSGQDSDGFVARITSDGLLDNSFATGGILSIPIDSGGDKQDVASTVALLDDNRILVGGWAATSSGSGYWLRRFTADGSPDSSFMGTALVTGSSTNLSVEDLLIEPSGQFLVLVLEILGGGSSRESSVYRYSADGASRTLVTAFSGSFRFFRMARAANGTIWLGGTFYNVGGESDIALGKIAGTTVSTFMQAVDLGGGLNDVGLHVVLQDGKPVVVGLAEHASGAAAVALRFNTTGTIDSSFGTNGVATIVQFDTIDAAASAAVTYGDDLIVAGQAVLGASSNGVQFAARLTSDGSLDTGFGSDGGVTYWEDYDLGGTLIDTTASVHVDTLGRILITGDAVKSVTDWDITVTRLQQELFADGFESGNTTAWQ